MRGRYCLRAVLCAVLAGTCAGFAMSNGFAVSGGLVMSSSAVLADGVVLSTVLARDLLADAA